MARQPWNVPAPPSPFRFHSETLEIQTNEPLEFVDLSERILGCLRRSGVIEGMINVQTPHTTSAVVINENEPGFMGDMGEMLERLAPREARYRHDDFDARPTPVPADERENGHSHLQAVVLAPSVTLNVVDGAPALGRWQSVFFIELDGSRKRSVSIGVMGLAGAGGQRGNRSRRRTRRGGSPSSAICRRANRAS